MSEKKTKWKKLNIKRYTTLGKRTFEISIELDIDLKGSNHLGAIMSIEEIAKHE